MSYKSFSVFLLLVLSCAFGKNEEGDNCMIESGKAGVCTHISNCSAVLEAAFEGIPPQVCSYVGTVPIVCCDADAVPRTNCRPLPESTVTISKTGSKARDYCISLAEQAYPCLNAEAGFTRGDICPSLPAKDAPDGRVFTGDYPHFALLGYEENGDKNPKGFVWFHLGSLISEEWVITETWCARLTKFIRLGGLSWNSETPPANVFTVKKLVIHPEANNDFNDVGLLQLDRKAIFSKFTFPACLHTGTVFDEKDLIYVTHQGNGYDRWNITVRSDIQCTDLFPTGFRGSTQMCARRTRENLTVWESEKRASLGIAGSPVQINNDASVACTQLIIGVTAGEDSTKLNLLLTRVNGLIPWIESIVWP